ncbi:F-box/kelch-repeat protein At3g06240-like isoform X2 [Cynara cardunculus var. scolymus]|uniref:F-box/kelch-repeat protein At3g06240-like isoform X2 n=1 Tax=Cynara cardunculus var. scolymus TaxID=59895 RepID=UPI000D627C48|nr:F-box/kelch-repeat protein At3g06240-like isoform X2 [Cynara cardunculus var. scolymus]
MSRTLFPEEVLEQILIRLSVKDLIRCRSVSKSWLSLISDPNFVKGHLKNSHNRDRNDDGIGNRRIVMSIIPCCYRHRLYERDDIFFDARECHLFGSANGLVCVSPSHSEILLVNPETREVNKLKNPHIPEIGYLIGGFGYDPSTDDYKVVLGFTRFRGYTCFKVFTLKSNVWKVIGDFHYTLFSRVGILCNGALHWVAKHDNKKAILSFDLSEDKLKEIPQPDHVLYEVGIAGYSSMRLGTLDDRLCAYRSEMVPYNIWVMNNYNVKQSWELVDPESKTKYEAVHRLKDLKHYIPNKRSFCHEKWIVKTPEFVGSLTYVPSLVSPHVCRKLKRKRPETGSTKSGKISSCGNSS